MRTATRVNASTAAAGAEQDEPAAAAVGAETNEAISRPDVDHPRRKSEVKRKSGWGRWRRRARGGVLPFIRDFATVLADATAKPREAATPAMIAEEGSPRTSLSSNIVIDPALAPALREHQLQGVRFLHHCLMGLRPAQQACNGCGAILADAMGLGKTLQALTVLWAFLHQPQPRVLKAIIVCPASLVSNWYREIDRWLEGRCHCTLVASALNARSTLKKFAVPHDAFAQAAFVARCLC